MPCGTRQELRCAGEIQCNREGGLIAFAATRGDVPSTRRIPFLIERLRVAGAIARPAMMV
jgi:hypothetical protein